MCAGGIAAITPAVKGNYGFAPAGAPPPIAQDERQWYIDQGFGDPNEVIGARKAGPAYVSGKNYMGRTQALVGSYRGVSPEARYLYKQSLVPKAAPAAAQPAPVPTLAVPPATTRWAGNALTINPMSS